VVRIHDGELKKMENKMEQEFNDGFFGVFLLLATLLGMWAVSAYNKMVERIKDKEKDN
jgi:hypothetical protein